MATSHAAEAIYSKAIASVFNADAALTRPEVAALRRFLTVAQLLEAVR